MVGLRKFFKTEVLRWLENAILNLAAENKSYFAGHLSRIHRVF